MYVGAPSASVHQPVVTFQLFHQPPSTLPQSPVPFTSVTLSTHH